MESYTHDEYIQALRMNGKDPAVEDIDKEQKRLDDMARKKDKKEGEAMGEFTHDMYIEALKMQGKTAQVTAKTLEDTAEKEKQRGERVDQVGYKKTGDMTLAAQWEKEHEEEKEIRRQAKEKASSIKTTTTTTRPKKPETPPQTKPTEATPHKENLLKTHAVGHADVRNHVFLINTTEENLVAALRENSYAVTSTPNLQAAKEVLETHITQPTPQNINLTVLITPLHGDSETISEFIQWVRQPSGAGPPPGVLLYNDTFNGKLQNPPYVMSVKNMETILKYVKANGSDVTLDKETELLNNLVATEDRRAAGEVYASGIDHDIRSRNGAAVETVEIGMHWKGMIDLDLSCILLNEKGGRCGMVYFANLEYGGGGVFQHSGDMMSAPVGEKECITVNLVSVPPEVTAMYFVITSYSGDPFQDVVQIDASITIPQSGESLAQFPLTSAGPHRAVVLCRMYRTTSTSWGVTNVNTTHDRAETARALVAPVQKHYRENPPNTY
eukprot:TRINITY_DN7526_c0_g2_i1.p1 TRINITY_DN7526_c0_g2~~TRINITY_DN7526_c0_g2_i1.p1  ORF type:complete len:498 (+),score=82.25 TRINITY_DN7526_c0_g2_i1:60-1553(+)